MRRETINSNRVTKAGLKGGRGDGGGGGAGGVGGARLQEVDVGGDGVCMTKDAVIMCHMLS